MGIDPSTARNLFEYDEGKMILSLPEFLYILARARQVKAPCLEWLLWDSYCFDDIGAIQINDIMAESYAETEKIDLKLYRLFHGAVLQ